MSLARPAAARTASLTREKTVCSSSFVTPVVLVGLSPPSNLVSVPKSAAESVWVKRADTVCYCGSIYSYFFFTRITYESYS